LSERGGTVWKHTIGLGLDHAVALATQYFEIAPVNDRYSVVCVLDNAERMQVPGGFDDLIALRSQHMGEQPSRYRQGIALQAIQREQQPTTKLLLHRVMTVADRRLGHLRDQASCLAQDQSLQLAVAI
jgi:hypothetical protein